MKPQKKLDLLNKASDLKFLTRKRIIIIIIMIIMIILDFEKYKNCCVIKVPKQFLVNI